MAAQAQQAEPATEEMDVDEGADIRVSKGLQDIFEGNQNHSFSKCEIDVSTLFDATGQKLNTDQDDFLDLSCLDDLRPGAGEEGAFFMPNRIFIRSEMQTMFSDLLTKSSPQEKRKILTGSAGIGKSVLLFLVALRYQLLPQNAKKKVAYIRKVKEDDLISFFLMEVGGPSTVRIVSSHSIGVSDYPSNFDMWIAIRGYTTALKTTDYEPFVDGPVHTEKMDLLNMGFRFLCTSGGYPTVSQSEIRATKVKILSGWREETILLVLTKMGQPVERAQEAYALSGGRIRLAIGAIETGGIDEVKKWFDDLIDGFGQDKIVLAVTKTDSHAAISHSDRLRTRFINYDGNGTSLLIVDSFYATSKLKGRLALDDFISSFNLAGVCGLQSARGWFFEEIMHLWFKKKDSALIEDWVRSVGDAAQGIKYLNRAKLYWISATPNFANIDAAFVFGNVLVCIQYTVKKNHDFNQDTFWQDFASEVKTAVSFASIAVWFVSPDSADFQNTHIDYDQTYAPVDGIALRSNGQLPSMRISFRIAEVKCESTELVNTTAPQLPFLDEQLYKPQIPRISTEVEGEEPSDAVV